MEADGFIVESRQGRPSRRPHIVLTLQASAQLLQLLLTICEPSPERRTTGLADEDLTLPN
jgi:hypothetical protein